MTVVWRTSLIVTTAALTAAALSGCQRGDAAPPQISAPMQVVNNRPIVTAEVISGDGEAHTMQMLIDTGGLGVTFTPTAAKRAGLELGKRRRFDDGLFNFVELKAVRIGKTRIELGGVEPRVALDTERDVLAGVDGAIGADVLRQYGRVTLQFPTKRIVLGEAPATPAIGALVPTRYDDGRFIARITLGNATHRLVVDSGAVTTYTIESTAVRITGTRQGVWGKVVLAPFEVVSDPDFEGDGLLGANLLARFTVRIDFNRRTMRISTT